MPSAARRCRWDVVRPDQRDQRDAGEVSGDHPRRVDVDDGADGGARAVAGQVDRELVRRGVAVGGARRAGLERAGDDVGRTREQEARLRRTVCPDEDGLVVDPHADVPEDVLGQAGVGEDAAGDGDAPVKVSGRVHQRDSTRVIKAPISAARARSMRAIGAAQLSAASGRPRSSSTTTPTAATPSSLSLRLTA